MRFNEVHFNYAKGHAVASLKIAEAALAAGNLQIAKLALKEASSFITTLADDTILEGAPMTAVDKFVEIAVRRDAVEKIVEDSAI